MNIIIEQTLEQKFKKHLVSAAIIESDSDMKSLLDKEIHCAKAEAFAYCLYLITKDSSEYHDNILRIEKARF